MVKMIDGINRKLKRMNKIKMKYYIVSESNMLLSEFYGFYIWIEMFCRMN